MLGDFNEFYLATTLIIPKMFHKCRNVISNKYNQIIDSFENA